MHELLKNVTSAAAMLAIVLAGAAAIVALGALIAKCAGPFLQP
jgi:hypothetical protein